MNLFTDIAAAPGAPGLPSTRAARSVTVLLALHGFTPICCCPWRSMRLLCCVRLLLLLLLVLLCTAWLHLTPPQAHPLAVRPVLLLLAFTARPAARVG